MNSPKNNTPANSQELNSVPTKPSETEKRKNGGADAEDNKKLKSVTDVKDVVLEVVHDKLEKMGDVACGAKEKMTEAKEKMDDIGHAVMEKVHSAEGKLADAKEAITDKISKGGGEMEDIPLGSAKERVETVAQDVKGSQTDAAAA